MALTRSKSSSAGKSILDAEHRELAAKESELQAKIAAARREISEAPRKARENAERERNSILNATRGEHRHNTLVDTRRPEEATPRWAQPAPMLRTERRAARLQAFTLFLLLCGALIWAAYTYLW